MDASKVIPSLHLSGFPVGFGGCRNDGINFDCCEYNITIFDGKIGESIHEVSGNMVKLHHCSLSENRPEILTQLKNITILSDEQWELRMLLSKIKEKSREISRSCALSCLVDAGIFANKAKDAAKIKDPFAGVWIKCASYFLADALFSVNSKRPSPTHMLEITRNLRKEKVNQTFSSLHQVLGIERASTSVLSRMVKSTIGFSDMIENNGHSKIIQRKYDYLTDNSLLADCYFYLGYVNRNNVIKVKNQVHKNPEYIHVLRVAFDIESDLLVVAKQAAALLQATNELLADIKKQR